MEKKKRAAKVLHADTPTRDKTRDLRELKAENRQQLIELRALVQETLRSCQERGHATKDEGLRSALIGREDAMSKRQEFAIRLIEVASELLETAAKELRRDPLEALPYADVLRRR